MKQYRLYVQIQLPVAIYCKGAEGRLQECLHVEVKNYYNEGVAPVRYVERA